MCPPERQSVLSSLLCTLGGPCYGLCHPLPLVLRLLLVFLPWEIPADTGVWGNGLQIVTVSAPFLSATVLAGPCSWGHSFRAH